MKELTLTGNLGGDPVKRSNNQGEEFISFSVAHYEGKTKDGQTKKPTWVDVILSADSYSARYIMEKAKKGSKVLVKGRNNVNLYQKKDGTWAYTENLYLNTIEIFDFADAASTTELSNDDGASHAVKNITTDDIPF